MPKRPTLRQQLEVANGLVHAEKAFREVKLKERDDAYRELENRLALSRRDVIRVTDLYNQAKNEIAYLRHVHETGLRACATNSQIGDVMARQVDIPVNIERKSDMLDAMRYGLDKAGR